MKTILPKALCLLLAAGLLASCKTTRGLGRDIQHLGAKIEEKATENTSY